MLLRSGSLAGVESWGYWGWLGGLLKAQNGAKTHFGYNRENRRFFPSLSIHVIKDSNALCEITGNWGKLKTETENAGTPSPSLDLEPELELDRGPPPHPHGQLLCPSYSLFNSFFSPGKGFKPTKHGREGLLLYAVAHLRSFLVISVSTPAEVWDVPEIGRISAF